eukprot:8159462-Alexandrium_andersonii.AAC.1
MTLNVRSLMKPTMQHQTTSYMRKRNIDVAMLQETRAPTTTQYLSDGHNFVLFGGGGKVEYGGVGFVLNGRA